MQTDAVFEDIAKRLHLEILKASKSIIVAVAWFTNPILFIDLCDKAKNGLEVELMMMNDEINKNSSVNYDNLIIAGGKVWMIGNDDGTNRLMHNKFCIIDDETVINGSYNWTNKANSNHESITIVEGNPALAEQFSREFKTIKELYFGAGTRKSIADFGIICSRLKTLKETIRIGDSEDIKYLLLKLKKTLNPINDSNLSLVYNIITEIENENFSKAILGIDDFIKRYNSLNVYIDTEIAALRLELKSLEIQVSTLEDEKVELEKLVHEFEVMHNNELGAIILKILILKKEKYQKEFAQNPEKENEFQEAKNDYDAFRKTYNNLSNEKVKDLSEDQRIELKKLYRNASKLCHPDAVAEQYKEKAEYLFRELNSAYNANDLEKIKILHADLQKGLFRTNSEMVNEKSVLSQKVNYLRLLRDDLERNIFLIKKSEPYKIISTITNWNTYFSDIKEQLITELKTLEIKTRNESRKE
ncbi:MAG: phospholipase D-like domain-containing protein [Bacteroidales bacterium]